jgi:hypothetical protein
LFLARANGRARGNEPLCPRLRRGLRLYLSFLRERRVGRHQPESPLVSVLLSRALADLTSTFAPSLAPNRGPLRPTRFDEDLS